VCAEEDDGEEDPLETPDSEASLTCWLAAFSKQQHKKILFKLFQNHVCCLPRIFFIIRRCFARMYVAAASRYQRMLFVCKLSPMLRSIFVAASQGACWNTIASEF
jgi:hypothetical protein